MFKPQEIKRVNKIFKSLGNERRLKILSLLLGEGPMSVSEISEKINFSLKSTSKHCIILDRAGLVEGRQIGLNRIYDIDDEVRKLLVFFFQKFT
ncbi:MAG: ArsR/SmtB family transcription factor [Patescibacteria group bacterium]